MAQAPRDRKTRSQAAARSQKRSSSRRPQRAGKTAPTGPGKTAGGAGEGEEFSGKSAAELRDAINRGVISPHDIVMLTRERIEQVVGDAVKRGRMTADDASELARGLVSFGRKQTNEVLSELERLLERGFREARSSRRRGRSAAGRARKRVEAATTRAREAAARTAEPLVASPERVHPAAAMREGFPLPDYDELTAAQIQRRLKDLSDEDLRLIRDYELETTNRKTVLKAIDARLR